MKNMISMRFVTMACLLASAFVLASGAVSAQRGDGRPTANPPSGQSGAKKSTGSSNRPPGQRSEAPIPNSLDEVQSQLKKLIVADGTYFEFLDYKLHKSNRFSLQMDSVVVDDCQAGFTVHRTLTDRSTGEIKKLDDTTITVDFAKVTSTPSVTPDWLFCAGLGAGNDFPRMHYFELGLEGKQEKERNLLF